MKDATEVWLLIIGVVGATFTAIWQTWKNLRRLSRMVDQFLGYEDAQGRDIPGLVERVSVLETDMAELKRLMSIHLSTVHGIDVERELS